MAIKLTLEAVFRSSSCPYYYYLVTKVTLKPMTDGSTGAISLTLANYLMSEGFLFFHLSRGRIINPSITKIAQMFFNFNQAAV